MADTEALTAAEVRDMIADEKKSAAIPRIDYDDDALAAEVARLRGLVDEANLRAACHARDAELRAAEVARLTGCLARANSYERRYYLATDETDDAQAEVARLRADINALMDKAALVRDEAGDHPGAVAAMPAPLRRAILDLLTALGAKGE